MSTDETQRSKTNSEQDDPATDDESFTSNTQVRWRALASFLTVLLVGAYIVLVGLYATGAADPSNVPADVRWLFRIIVLAAVGWTYGIDLIERWAGGSQ